MDFRFNKSIILIVSLSSLLLSCTNAVPSTRVLDLNLNLPNPITTGLNLLNPTAAASAPAPAESSTLVGSLVSDASEAMKGINPEILKFCVGTENPTLCADTISSSLVGKFEPLKALEVEVEATLNQSKNVAGIIEKLIKNPLTNQFSMDALGICKEQYDNILDTLNEAVGLIQKQNVVDAYYKFSSVISYRSACEDTFDESPGLEMPFPQESLRVFQLGGNCLDLMNGIVNHHKI